MVISGLKGLTDLGHANGFSNRVQRKWRIKCKVGSGFEKRAADSHRVVPPLPRIIPELSPDVRKVDNVIITFWGLEACFLITNNFGENHACCDGVCQTPGDFGICYSKTI